MHGGNFTRDDFLNLLKENFNQLTSTEYESYSKILEEIENGRKTNSIFYEEPTINLEWLFSFKNFKDDKLKDFFKKLAKVKYTNKEGDNILFIF